jgi:CDP-diglyceride synthetase
MEYSQKHSDGEMHGKHYRLLLIMAVLSFICMYILMYSMVNEFSNVFPNVNQFYMAGLMTAPMLIIEVLLMKQMYKNSKLNAVVIGISAVALIAFYFGIRKQVGVSDRQFLKSMIPHHAGAILMCNDANITDPEIKKLCEEIVASQEKEIAQMKAKLRQLDEK